MFTVYTVPIFESQKFRSSEKKLRVFYIAENKNVVLNVFLVQIQKR